MPKKLKSAQQDSATATVETRTEVLGVQDGMPRSAIGTGLVDYELRPEKMPARPLADAAVAPRIENAIKKVILRTRTGHDFGQYKPSTVNRRIERRMTVQQIDSIDDCVRLLQLSPTKVTALFKDLLISVTKFFRDPEAFKVLEDEGLSKLLAGRDEGAPVRVWVPGCFTGEEAYSVAILLAECQKSMKRRFKVQVFATDIDRQAVATARTGIYPESIAADLAPERLARYFSAEQDGSPGGPVRYRVHKDVASTRAQVPAVPSISRSRMPIVNHGATMLRY